MARAKNEAQALGADDEALDAGSADNTAAPTEALAPAHEAAAAPQLVRARVLCQCDFGVPGDVVEIDAELARTRTDVLDTDPAAVAYAESLKG